MNQGLNIPDLGVVDAARFTSPAIFSNSNVGGFASSLNITNLYTGQTGGLRRRAGLPDNWALANPQHGARLTSNFASSTYHALQVEVTRRLASGWTLGGNYTWSRALGEEEGDGVDLFDSFRTLRNRRTTPQ